MLQIFIQDICNMRFHFLLAAILIFTINSVYSQTFRAHILGGAATSQISGDQLAGFNKAGIIGGAGVNTTLSKKALLSFEIYFIQKGSQKQTDVENNDLEYYRLRLNYIEIPVLLEYHVSEKLSIQLGPCIGSLISSSEENQFGQLDFQPSFIKYEVSVIGGLNYYFGENWGMLFRGEQSIAPVREHGSGAVYRLNRGQYNSVLLFGMFYRFGNSKK